MSGFEIVGLVLGAFPLILEGVKELQSPIQKMRFYWKFQTKFEIFVADVNKERIVYDQNLDFIISFLDIDPNNKLMFPDGIPDSFWGEQRVGEELRRKLKDHHFNEFIAELNKMHNALEGLYKLLPTEKVHQTDGQDIQSLVFRLKTSFLGSKDEFLSQLKQSNEWIYRYLDRATRITADGTPHEQQRPDKYHEGRLKDFQSLQVQARSLYSCFQKSWNCGCPDGHPCGITVQQSKAESNRNHNIMILFDPSNGPGTSRVKFRISESRSQLKEKDRSCPRESKQHKIDGLSQQVSAKNLHGKPHGGLNVIPELLNSTFGFLGGSELVNDNRLHRAPVKLRRSPRLLHSKSSSSGINTAASVKQSRTTRSSQRQILTPSAKRVRFSTDISDATSENVEDDEGLIRNICESICFIPKSPCLGFLESDDQKRIYLHSEPSSQPHQHDSPLTIKSFSRDQKSRFKRLDVGLSTVLLIASIGDTCWLTPSWATSGLLLVGEDEQLGFHPYIVHSSLQKSLRGKAKIPTRPETFYLLGIVILELVFGEEFSTATQSFRSAHLGMDGKPNELTEFCTAMEWAKMAGGQVGDRLSNGIEWCIGFLLDDKKHLSSSECLREMWDRLIAPLEHFLELWVHDPVV